jgi:hypothetical protein
MPDIKYSENRWNATAHLNEPRNNVTKLRREARGRHGHCLIWMDRRRALFRNLLNFGTMKDDHNNAGRTRRNVAEECLVEASRSFCIEKITVEDAVRFITFY